MNLIWRHLSESCLPCSWSLTHSFFLFVCFGLTGPHIISALDSLKYWPTPGPNKTNSAYSITIFILFHYYFILFPIIFIILNRLHAQRGA